MLLFLPNELAEISDRILQTRKFKDYPGARNGLQVSHGRPVKKIGWAVDADLKSIRRAGKEKVDFLVVHHGVFWGDSPLDRGRCLRKLTESSFRIMLGTSRDIQSRACLGE